MCFFFCAQVICTCIMMHGTLCIFMRDCFVCVHRFHVREVPCFDACGRQRLRSRQRSLRRAVVFTRAPLEAPTTHHLCRRCKYSICPRISPYPGFLVYTPAHSICCSFHAIIQFTGVTSVHDVTEVDCCHVAGLFTSVS